MDDRGIYEVWAPQKGIWSLWARPVLFAHLTSVAEPGGTGSPGATSPPPPWSSMIAAPGSEGAALTACVVDLPGGESILAGMALAERGYRPVPMYDGCSGVGEVVDQGVLIFSLLASTPHLRSLALRDDAPPAFLLDSHRMLPSRPVRPGAFDNRWMVFPHDFPSLRTLQERRITRVVLVRNLTEPLQGDLAHVLHGWQKAGLQILSLDPGSPSAPSPFLVPRWRWYKTLGLWLSRAGLRPNASGGFGGRVPELTGG